MAWKVYDSTGQLKIKAASVSLTDVSGTLPVVSGGTGISLSGSTGVLEVTAGVVSATTSTGTGAPVKATSPTIATPTLTTPTATNPVLNGSLTGTGIDTDSTMAANSNTVVPSQAAVKSKMSLSENMLDKQFFGDGSDGDVTVTTGISLSRDMYYHNLTISGAGSIQTRRWRIFVSGVFDISDAGAAALTARGSNGSGSGFANSQTPASNIGAGQQMGAGGAITNGAGSSPATSQQNAIGGAGGAGGRSGGNATPTAGSTLVNVINFNRLCTEFLQSGLVVMGGLGGSGGNGGNVVGAAGGSGGDWIAVYARTINRGGSTAAGCILADGGDGGAAGASGSTSGAGGGGGAGGGYIYIAYKSLTGSLATAAVQTNGGAGGKGGNSTGGTAGSGGQGGGGGLITLIGISAGTITTTTGSAGSAGSANSGTTGGNGGAGGTLSSNL